MPISRGGVDIICDLCYIYIVMMKLEKAPKIGAHICKVYVVQADGKKEITKPTSVRKLGWY